jgi:acyl-[acyl-carrier-protein]-phospholipid O-acyltransferase/long-chain-fatty-acid--[acyl-carrier-protein] ligase
MGERGLPNLWVPGQRDFYAVPELPHLGSGKLDLKGLKDRALELTAKK